MSTTQHASAQIGGIPTTTLDVPICAVLIVIFAGLAASHMTLLQRNRNREHKFLFNGMCFGFAMSRIVACIFRMIWATQPTNADISLVAAVFLNAGILLAYIINIFFSWRMVRSTSPSFGWNRTIRILNRISLWFILFMILPLIVIIILRVKRPNLPGISMASNVVGKLAQTYFLLINVEAGLLLVYAYMKKSGEYDRYGKGSWGSKVVVLGTTIALATIEAGFRFGTAWSPAPLASDPAWWDSKAAFYCFNFVIDILLLTVYLVMRIDRGFHVPNKADGSGSYSGDVGGREKGNQAEIQEATY